MSEIDKMIARVCPDGVSFKSLDELGTTYGGLSGKGKADFSNGNARFVAYMNIYSNLGVDLRADQFVRVQAGEKQNALRCGDVLFTGSSETPDDVGMSSVVLEEPTEPVYLNSFCFGYRLNDPTALLPGFSKYVFRSDTVRRAIARTASGVTRFNISKSRFLKLRIPVPPVEVQREIVKVLDNFTELGTELETELEARRRQYQYYRDALLTHVELGSASEASAAKQASVQWTTLNDVSKAVTTGGTPLSTRQDYYNGDIPWLRTQEVRFIDIHDTEVKITERGLEGSSAKWIPANCVILAISGATAGRSAINKIRLTTNQHCCNFEIDPAKASYRYVFYWVSREYEKLKALGQGARADLNAGIIKKFPIAVPSLEEQARIVAILDKFDALVNDPSIGLPAELKARRKQYEYYRDRLLTFREAA